MQKIKLSIPQPDGNIKAIDVEFDEYKLVSHVSSFPVYLSVDGDYIIKRWETRSKLNPENFKSSKEYREAELESYYYNITHRFDEKFFISEPIFHIGSGELQGSIYLVMTKLAGKTLDEVKDLSLKDSLKLTIMLADLIVSLHANTIKTGHSIIHGDLKPQNILFNTREDGLFELHIIDYGMGFTPKHKSKHANDLYETALEVNRNNMYTAPELKDRIIGFKTDIFMLGGVLIETLLKDHLSDDAKKSGIEKALMDLIKLFLQRMQAHQAYNRPQIEEVLRFFLIAQQYLNQPDETVKNYAKMACVVQWGWPKGLSESEFLFDQVEFSSRIIEHLKEFELEKYQPLIGQSVVNILTFLLMSTKQNYLDKNDVIKKAFHLNADKITRSSVALLQNSIDPKVALQWQVMTVTKENCLGRLLASIPQSKFSKLFSRSPLDEIARTPLDVRVQKSQLSKK